MIANSMTAPLNEVVTEQEFARAVAAGTALRQKAFATAARYDRKDSRLLVSLNNGVELAVPGHLLEGLAGADPDALSEIELSLPASASTGRPLMPTSTCLRCLPACSVPDRGWHPYSARKVARRAPRKRPPPRAPMDGRAGARPGRKPGNSRKMAARCPN